MEIETFSIEARSHYDAGYQIGARLKGVYARSFLTEPFLTLAAFRQTDYGSKMFSRFVGAIEQCFPDITQEIHGLAEGSGLPVENFLLHAMLTEVCLFYLPDGPGSEITRAAGERCTDVLVNSAECRMVAHNEDWFKECAGKCFIADVNITKHAAKDKGEFSAGKTSNDVLNTLSDRDERFVTFLTPGDLCGLCFSMNRHFVFTVNSQFPNSTWEGGVPVGVLLRALLACETIEECVEVMKNEPFGCCFGINVNIASTQTTDMWSLEVYTEGSGSRVVLQPLPYQAGDTERRHYVHANHLIYTDDVEQEDYRHSYDREETALGLPTPSDLEGVCAIMGDTSHRTHPIFRRYSREASATVATSIFDMDSKHLLIYSGNPISTPPHLIIPFIED